MALASIIDEKGKGIGLGASEYLIKPVDRANLIQAVEKFIGQNVGRKILVVFLICSLVSLSRS